MYIVYLVENLLNILWPQLLFQPYFRWNIIFKPFEVSILIILQIYLRVMVRASMYVKCIPLKYSIPSPLVFIILKVGGIAKFLSFYKIPAGKYIIGCCNFDYFFHCLKRTMSNFVIINDGQHYLRLHLSLLFIWFTPSKRIILTTFLNH